MRICSFPKRCPTSSRKKPWRYGVSRPGSRRSQPLLSPRRSLSEDELQTCSTTPSGSKQFLHLRVQPCSDGGFTLARGETYRLPNQHFERSRPKPATSACLEITQTTQRHRQDRSGRLLDQQPDPGPEVRQSALG